MLESEFCVSALEEALGKYGTPEIFNTGQGSQFTSLDFTRTLNEAAVRISMDGKGRWKDNIMIERLWRSLKNECVYLKAFEGRREARGSVLIRGWTTGLLMRHTMHYQGLDSQLRGRLDYEAAIRLKSAPRLSNIW